MKFLGIILMVMFIYGIIFLKLLAILSVLN